MIRRIWRSSQEELLPSRDDFQPLETHEQVEIVQAFERNHALQNTVWRGIFSALLSTFAGFFVYSANRQSISPWDARYHAYFMEEVDSSTVIFADFVAVVVFMLAIAGLLWKSKLHIYCLGSSAAIGLLLACFWLYHMLRLSRFRWDVIWLPLGPLSCAGMCIYIDRLLLEGLEDIKQLRSTIYHFKRS